MENFEKQIYLNPEWQNGQKNEKTAEQVEASEKVAEQKLERILTPGFRDFAVRFMNLEEYRNLIENGELSGEFTLFDKKFPKEIDFSEFIKMFGDGWETRKQVSMTDWEEITGITSLTTMDLISSIVKIKKHYGKESSQKSNSVLREYLLKYIETGRVSFWVGKNDRDDYSRVYADSHDLEIGMKKKSQPNPSENENVKIIKSFQDDENFLEKQGNLRKLLIALGAMFDNDWDSQSRQYHLALIVDSNLVINQPNSWNDDNWRILHKHKSTELSKEQINKNVLAAISIYPLKEMHNEIIDLEKGSEDLTHPVFDHNGVVHWPKSN